MADRFPSIEEFSGGQTEAKGDPDFENISSGDADFLAREKAALGDDADLFATDNTQLNSSGPVQNDDNEDDDLLGGGDSAAGNDLGGDGISQFQSSFPAIDTNNPHVGPGGTITGSNQPYLSGPTVTSYRTEEDDEEEPEVIRQWREQRALAIQHRDELSEKRKAETIKAAQTAIDDFYENYNNKKEKTIAQTRREAEEFLANREDTAAGGTSWERIAKLVDLSGKGAKGGASGSSKERFRELLLSLKKDPNAPGATGY